MYCISLICLIYLSAAREVVYIHHAHHLPLNVVSPTPAIRQLEWKEYNKNKLLACADGHTPAIGLDSELVTPAVDTADDLISVRIGISI